MPGGSSDQGNAVAGGSSDQGNALHVQVLDRFGNPVVGARLEAVPSGWMSSSRPDSLGGPTVTDSQGQVSLQLVPGKYAVQGVSGLLRGLAEVEVSGGKNSTTLLLRATSDVVGLLGTKGVDTLFVPGTHRFGLVDSNGAFRIDSLPRGVDMLSTRDGRRIPLDTTGNGFERVYRSPLRFGGDAGVRPDTLLPKYVSSFVLPLPLDADRPAGSFDTWLPDTVFASGDTIWITTMVRACDGLPRDGLGGWASAESLLIRKRTCTIEQGEPVSYRFFLTPRAGIWYVNTLQPKDRSWEMP